jgi:hypothetical protein
MIIFGLKDGRMKTFDEAFNPLFGEYQHHLFVFTVHLTILTISALFFMHVQVSFISKE